MPRTLARVALCVALLAAVAACKPDPGAAQRQAEWNRADNRPIMIAEADGVRLWKVRDDTHGGSNYVYFSSRGDTVWEQSCGRNCREAVRVPSAP